MGDLDRQQAREHAKWCNVYRTDSKRTGCDCNGWRDDGKWTPNRNSAIDVGVGWNRFLERLNLERWPETDRFMIRGQDGWAFSAAVRFQRAAHDLAHSDEEYYWSGYHLIALIIEQARKDLTFLEAIEALAVAHVYGNLSQDDAVKQLQQMGVWPGRERR